MPIRPEQRHLYGPAWKRIARAVKADRAGWRCECCGECGRGHTDRCEEQHQQPARWDEQPALIAAPRRRAKRVVLTVAHLNRRPWDHRPENLRAMCQACHLAYDRADHAAKRSATWARRRTAPPTAHGQLPLVYVPAPAVQLALLGADKRIEAPAVALVPQGSRLRPRPGGPRTTLYAVEKQGQMRLDEQLWPEDPAASCTAARR